MSHPHRLQIFIFAALMVLLSFVGGITPCLAGVPPALATRFSPKDAKIIPLFYDPLTCPLPLVQVSVDGSEPLWFLVDTGASVPLILEKWAVTKLGLRLTVEDIQMSNRLYRQVETQNVVILGKQEDDNMVMPVSKAIVDEAETASGALGKHRRVAGIVGAPLLVRSVMQFDYRSRELRVWKNPEYTPPAIGRHQIIALERQQFESKGLNVKWYVPAKDASGIERMFLLDTGANTSAINEIIAEAVQYSSLIRRNNRRSISVSGEKTAVTSVVTNLTVGKITVRHWEASLGTSRLGNDLLSLFLITLNAPKDQLILEPYEPVSDKIKEETPLSPPLQGAPLYSLSLSKAGVFIVTEASDDVNKELDHQLRPGDVVQKIDGVSLSNLSLPMAQNLLNGYLDTSASVEIKRDGKEKRVILYRGSKVRFFAN